MEEKYIPRRTTGKSVKYLGLAVAVGFLFLAVCAYADSDVDARNGQGEKYWVEFRDKWDTRYYDTGFMSEDTNFTLPPADKLNMSSYTAYLNKETTGTSYGPGDKIPTADLKSLDSDNDGKIVLYITGGTVYEGTIYGNNPDNSSKGPMNVYGNTLEVSIPGIKDIVNDFQWKYPKKKPSHFNTKADNSGTSFQFGKTVTMQDLAAAINGNKIELYVIWEYGVLAPIVDFELELRPMGGFGHEWNETFTWVDGSVQLPPNGLFEGFPYTAYLSPDMTGESFGEFDEVPVDLLISKADGRKRVFMYAFAEVPWEQNTYKVVICDERVQYALLPFAADRGVILPSADDLYGYYEAYVDKNLSGDCYVPGAVIPPETLIPMANDKGFVFLYVEGEIQNVQYRLEICDKWEECYWSCNFMSTDGTVTLPPAEEANMSSYKVYAGEDMSGTGYGPGSKISVDALIGLDGDHDNVIRVFIDGGTVYDGYIHVTDTDEPFGPMYVYSNRLYVEMPSLADIVEAQLTNGDKIPSHFNTKGDDSGTPLQFGSRALLRDLIADADGTTIRLYLIWKDGDLPPDVEYTLALVPVGGTEPSWTRTFTWRNGWISLPSPNEVNMTYYVAYTKSDGTGDYYEPDKSISSNLLIDTADNNKTITLYFKKPSYTIVWKNGNDVVENVLSHGEKIVKPATDPVKEEDASYTYRFAGWRGYSEGASARSDKTFDAVFEPVLKNVNTTAASVEITKADSQTVVIPQDIVTQLKTAAGNEKKVSLDLSHGKIVMDSASVGSLTDGEKKVEIRSFSGTEISLEVAEKVGDNPVYSISIGDVREFNGKLTISLKYELKADEDPNDVRIWYIFDNGDYEAIACTYADGYATFETNHLSYYAVVIDKTPVVIPGGGNGDGGQKTDITLLAAGAIAALAVVGLAVFFLVRRR